MCKICGLDIIQTKFNHIDVIVAICRLCSTLLKELAPNVMEVAIFWILWHPEYLFIFSGITDAV